MLESERSKISLDRLQSTLKLRDAEILQKDTELEDKRSLLNKTKARTAIEELQDALVLSQRNEKRLETELEQLEEQSQHRIEEISAELVEVRQSLEASEKAKKLIQVDVLEREADLNRNNDRLHELEAELNNTRTTLQTHIKNGRELTEAMKQRETDLNECLDKITELERTKQELLALNETLEMRIKDAEDSEKTTLDKLQTKIEEHHLEIERLQKDKERQIKASRIDWIEQQLATEQKLKEEHRKDRSEIEASWKAKLSSLETENEELKTKQSSERAQLRNRLQKMIEQRLGDLNSSMIHAVKQLEKLEKDNMLFKVKMNEIEQISRTESIKKIQCEKDLDEARNQLEAKVFELKRRNCTLSAKLNTVRKFFLKKQHQKSSHCVNKEHPKLELEYFSSSS
eukprot:g4220.t1